MYVVVQIRPHDFFIREGDHIFCELPLTITQAALGDEVEVPTVHGKVKLKVPAGTQTGKTFRLKGKGAPNVRGRGQGDQHIKVKVMTPTQLTDRQKNCFVSSMKLVEMNLLMNRTKIFSNVLKKRLKVINDAVQQHRLHNFQVSILKGKKHSIYPRESLSNEMGE